MSPFKHLSRGCCTIYIFICCLFSLIGIFHHLFKVLFVTFFKFQEYNCSRAQVKFITDLNNVVYQQVAMSVVFKFELLDFSTL